MSVPPLAILDIGLVTPVGLSAPASCAAFRAKISNPTETRFIDSGGQWIMAHQVELEQPWRGLTRLAKMAAMAIDEAMRPSAARWPRSRWRQLPLLLCVAEKDRPGRTDGLDDRLMPMIAAELGATLAEGSAVIASGRAGVAVALQGARRLLDEGKAEHVLIAATDSLLSWPTLGHYEREGRLLGERNSNGFIPGEGAGALLVGSEAAAGAGASADAVGFVCGGIGFANEPATIQSDEPLRAEGLRQAIEAALTGAGLAMHDIDYRVTDLSGEHYYFKEAALALSRTLRQRKEVFDIWHPAECTGEAGAAVGVNVVALAQAAAAKGYAKGSRVMAHWANDCGQRCAAVFEQRSATRTAGGVA
jgi:3-oxoacyl-[acyl-carrier-protein] synthase-1